MSVPNYGPFCQTVTYNTSCRSCQQQIYVMQCTCSSAVLFDELGWPWPKHVCDNTGGSDLSGWQAVDVLRAHGVSISHDIVQKIFPPNYQLSRESNREQIEIVKIEPVENSRQTILAVVREIEMETKKTKVQESLPEFGKKLFGIDPKLTCCQVTLVDNTDRPNKSFTGLAPSHLVEGLKYNSMVMAEMYGRVTPALSIWVIHDMKPL